MVNFNRIHKTMLTALSASEVLLYLMANQANTGSPHNFYSAALTDFFFITGTILVQLLPIKKNEEENTQTSGLLVSKTKH